MTLKEAYEYGQERLNATGIEEYSIDAWYLLEFVTGLDRTSRMSRALYIKPIWNRGHSIFHFSISQVFRNLWDWNLR